MRFWTAAVFALIASPVLAQDVNRAIEPVTGDVYLMRNNFHNSLLVATEDGVVRVDPINAAAGIWVNENLGQIGAESVSHLIYSHSHGDHASGGNAHPEATVIMHTAAPEAIDGVSADLRVGDTHVLEIGGKTIELTNLGAGHDSHMLATVVRPENVAFIVDVAAPKRLPFRDFGSSDVDGWIAQIEAAQALDFEVFTAGHGNVGTKADLVDVHTYMTELRAAVLAGLQAGKSVDQLKDEITMEAYANWIQYEGWRPLNIEGMARFLTESGQAG